jgi:hypothetical protein
VGALWRDTQLLEDNAHGAGDSAADGCGLETRNGAVVALEGVVPGDVLRGTRLEALTDIEVILNNEAGVLHCLDDLLGSFKSGQAVSELNTVANAAVLLVGVVVLVGDDPFVADKACTWFEDAEDFRVALDLVGRVTRGLNGVGAVVGAGIEASAAEVGLGIADEVVEAVARVIAASTTNLVLVVVDTENLAPSEAGNVAGRATNTAAKVKDLHAGLEATVEGKEVLVAGEGFVEALTDVAGSKVERLTPSVLVEVRHKVIVFIHHGRRLSLAALDGGVVTVVTLTEAVSRSLNVLVGLSGIALAENVEWKSFALHGHFSCELWGCGGGIPSAQQKANTRGILIGAAIDSNHPSGAFTRLPPNPKIL